MQVVSSPATADAMACGDHRCVGYAVQRVFDARWPGGVPEATVSDHFFANYDTLASVADLLGAQIPELSDGISYLPALRGLDCIQRRSRLLGAH